MIIEVAAMIQESEDDILNARGYNSVGVSANTIYIRLVAVRALKTLSKWMCSIPSENYTKDMAAVFIGYKIMERVIGNYGVTNVPVTKLDKAFHELVVFIKTKVFGDNLPTLEIIEASRYKLAAIITKGFKTESLFEFDCLFSERLLGEKYHDFIDHEMFSIVYTILRHYYK